jgi:hypothetical protein
MILNHRQISSLHSPFGAIVENELSCGKTSIHAVKIQDMDYLPQSQNIKLAAA